MSNANPNSNNTVLVHQLSSVDTADMADYRTIRFTTFKGSPNTFGSTCGAEVELSAEAFVERLAITVVLGAYAGTDSDTYIVSMVDFKQQTIAELAYKGFVWGFYVAPAARRRGVGVALVERTVAVAAGFAQQLALSVAHSNDAALVLYECCGFETYGVEPRTLESAMGCADKVLMVRFLHS